MGGKIGFNFQTANNFGAADKQLTPPKTLARRTIAKTDEYIVRRGDTLTEIAVKTGQNLQELLKKNPQIKNPDRIRIGQHIEIGKPTNTCTVKKGDTLSAIARTHHTTVGDILRANPKQISNRNLIYPGQKLHLPKREAKTPTTTPPTTPTGTPPKPTETKTAPPAPVDAKTQTPVDEKPPVAPGKTEPFARSPHLKLKTKGIELSPLVEKKMSQIADEYFKKTGKNLTIIDGNRTAHDQAERVYDKIRHRGEDLYTNKKALAEIKAAYHEAARHGESREQIVNRMTQVIQNQAKRGTYISKHLTGQGADVRISDMTAADKKAFLESVAKVGGAHKLDEGDHWHMEIDENQKPPVRTPTETNAPVETKSGQTTTSGNLKIAQIDLDDFLSPGKGSNAGFAILIGNAEGNRTANGGFVKPNYYGHPDPGDGLWNIGSFSRANARFPNMPPARSPEEADKMHLQHMQQAKVKYVDAMKKAGLDPNNALLASVYFDAFNQSERAAKKMLAPENLNYLKGKELSVETMKEWRVGSFINLQTGQRWKNSDGSPVGGGLAKIANKETMKKFGRPATEQEIQQVIRRDQSRRVNEMIEPMKRVGLLRVENSPTTKPMTTGKIDSPTAPTAAADGGKATSTRHYRVREDVVLNENAKAKLSAIGREYQRKTGETIDITSGTRTPYKQANAMFAKIQLGDKFSDYTNREALSEILATYRQAKAAGKSPEQIKLAMSETIQNQVNRHSYISRHLQGGAADVSLRGLDQKAFREAVMSVTGKEPHYEGKPPHFHLQF